MKKIYGFIAVCLMYQGVSAQQEPHYTQNQFNSNLLLNPAYAGSGPCASVGLRYRNQWTGFEGAPVTFSFIGEMKIGKRLGIGFTLNHDKIGIDKILTPDLNIAYHLPVGEHGKLALGFKAGAGFMSSDFSKLSGVTNPDPLYNGDSKWTVPFIGLGLLYYTQKSYIGFSIPRVVSFEKTTARSKISKPHYYLYGGHRFVFDNGLELRPALMARFEPAAPLEFDFAADLWYRNIIGFGVAYRTGDALDFMLKGKFKKLYLGYSYDMTVSGLRTFNHGTHEIFVGYEFCGKQEEADPRTDNIRHF
jgi:type IX secretion system PorP/SprF family membrane protein